MPSDVAVRVSGLKKSYRISHREQHSTLAEQLLHRARHPFTRSEIETFWAIDGVDFEVAQGEIFGLIGRNGAGKSTLLKMLARITPPTEGRVELYGRVGSLLEVGTGFHPELTGRENIFLNGSILGMTSAEIGRLFDEIVDFSGVSRFLDTPVKRYSSGMYVRLAFAVAAHLSTEILLVDEVLAVGDSEFQERCIGKIHDVMESGRTVLFVSHNLDSVQRLCSRCLVLDRGTVRFMGGVGPAIEQYAQALQHAASDLTDYSRRAGSGEFRIVRAEPTKVAYDSASPKAVTFDVDFIEGGLSRYFVSCHIVDERRRVVAQCDSRLTEFWVEHRGGRRSLRFELQTPWLLPGRYDVDLILCNAGVIDLCERACTFEVLPQLPYPGAGGDDSITHNLVLPEFSYLENGEL